MRLEYVALAGFRGYRDAMRIDLGRTFTVIDGRNGVGKSTVFDAVEFALTGTISKYGTAKADRESVHDYIWWQGDQPAPASRYVEVGFVDREGPVAIRRTPASGPSSEIIEDFLSRMCEISVAPSNPLPQLCSATILRDEQISALSLDLNESARYTLLRDAIGAADASTWIERANQIWKAAKERAKNAQAQVTAATDRLNFESRRIDALRQGVSREEVVSAAVQRLHAFTGTRQPLDNIAEFARKSLTEKLRERDAILELLQALPNMVAAQKELSGIQDQLRVATDARQAAETTLESVRESGGDIQGSDSPASLAKQWAELVTLGESMGTQDQRCPLCWVEHTAETFREGTEAVRQRIATLNKTAVRIAQYLRDRDSAEEAVAEAARKEQGARGRMAEVERLVSEFEQKLAMHTRSTDVSEPTLQDQLAGVEQSIADARDDLRILESADTGRAFAEAARAVAAAKDQHARAEERLGRARRTEARAKTFLDAARRSAAEALNQRLERVLPLMVELYHRLRPHPVWSDIEYRIRGDVQRFLRLQVGDSLNPQFMFSSGQRRATGLAFLLAVNMSLAWSRWETVLLDDPVQHIDDYRSVHLAELLAQLAASGKQIICAVEDPALADMMCRRLSGSRSRMGRRVTLGPGRQGTLSVLREEDAPALAQRVLLSGQAENAG